MTVGTTSRPHEVPPLGEVPSTPPRRPDRQMRRRRRVLGALVGGTVVMVASGAAVGSAAAEVGGAVCATLLGLYLLQLGRLRRRSLECNPLAAGSRGWSADELADWLPRVAAQATVDPAGTLEALRAAAPVPRPRSPEGLLDRWPVTHVLWAGVVGSFYNLLLGLAERLAAGSSMGGVRRRLLTVMTALLDRLGHRSARALALSALATASTTGLLAASAGAATVRSAADAPVHATLTDDATAAAPTTSAVPVTYTVRWGDTLWALAARYGTTVQAIAAANGIANPDVIYAGQVLAIPSGAGPVTAAAPAPSPAAPAAYTVQPGDTLWSLAARYGTTVQAIAAANGIANPDVIYAGQVLAIPSGAGPVTAAAPAPTPAPAPPPAPAPTPAPASSIAGYANPLRAVANLAPERIDQGVDYAGSGPIYAIGDGVVLNTTNGGWPGGAFISYQLSNGSAAGDIVYVAENVVPRVQVGQQVTPTTVVGTLVDASPDLETGWARPPGNGNAAATGQWNTATSTAYGENFSQLLQALGAPPGVTEGTVQGTLPAGWPTW